MVILHVKTHLKASCNSTVAKSLLKQLERTYIQCGLSVIQLKSLLSINFPHLVYTSSSLILYFTFSPSSTQQRKPPTTHQKKNQNSQSLKDVPEWEARQMGACLTKQHRSGTQVTKKSVVWLEQHKKNLVWYWVLVPGVAYWLCDSGNVLCTSQLSMPWY